ncbi:MAG: hypothetical protein QXJ20_03125 [Candidatus Aenigmatarchaeota archaeon]
MIKWIRNPYKDNFDLIWNGQIFSIPANETAPVPDEILNAYFPSAEFLSRFLTGNPERDLIIQNGFLEIFYNRWLNSNENFKNYVKRTGNILEDLNNFYEFISNFEIIEGEIKKPEPEVKVVKEVIKKPRLKKSKIKVKVEEIPEEKILEE